jgi:hypothetical protein
MMVMTEEALQPSERFSLKDGQRPLTLVGWKLAHVASQTGEDARWTELTLYRTLNNRYVVEKVGRSDVFHSLTCPRRNKGQEYPSLQAALADKDADEDDTVEDIFVPCKKAVRSGEAFCNPSYDESPVGVERDIYSVAVHESARAMVESLYRPDKDDTRFLSRVARALLDAAAQSDQRIREVLEATSDIT